MHSIHYRASYSSTGTLEKHYDGTTGREMDCDSGNVRVDVYALLIFPDAYLCDQRLSDMRYAS